MKKYIQKKKAWKCEHFIILPSVINVFQRSGSLPCLYFSFSSSFFFTKKRLTIIHGYCLKLVKHF